MEELGMSTDKPSGKKSKEKDSDNEDDDDKNEEKEDDVFGKSALQKELDEAGPFMRTATGSISPD